MGPYFAHVLCQSCVCSNIFSMDMARVLGTLCEPTAAELAQPSPASQVYQIFLGDDPVSEKDASSRPDWEEWCLAKWAELDTLISTVAGR